MAHFKGFARMSALTFLGLNSGAEESERCFTLIVLFRGGVTQPQIEAKVNYAH